MGLPAVSFVETDRYGMVTRTDVLAGAGWRLLQGTRIVPVVVAGSGRFGGEEPPATDDRLRRDEPATGRLPTRDTGSSRLVES